MRCTRCCCRLCAVSGDPWFDGGFIIIFGVSNNGKLSVFLSSLTLIVCPFVLFTVSLGSMQNRTGCCCFVGNATDGEFDVDWSCWSLASELLLLLLLPGVVVVVELLDKWFVSVLRVSSSSSSHGDVDEKCFALRCRVFDELPLLGFVSFDLLLKRN